VYSGRYPVFQLSRKETTAKKAQNFELLPMDGESDPLIKEVSKSAVTEATIPLILATHTGSNPRVTNNDRD
jgi:hypothetical protein